MVPAYIARIIGGVLLMFGLGLAIPREAFARYAIIGEGPPPGVLRRNR